MYRFIYLGLAVLTVLAVIYIFTHKVAP